MLDPQPRFLPLYQSYAWREPEVARLGGRLEKRHERAETSINMLSPPFKAKFPHNYKVLFIGQNHNHLD